jgi:hypothetical protein
MKPAPAWLVPAGFGTLLLLSAVYVTLHATVDEVSNWRAMLIKLVAPVVAGTVMIAAGVGDEGRARWRRWALNLAVPVGIGALYVSLAFLCAIVEIAGTKRGNALSMGLPILGCYILLRHPWRFTGAVACLLALAAISPGTAGVPLETSRSFFGVHRVVRTPSGAQFTLLNGNTEHGAQFRNPESRPIPITYYHPTGPAGDVFKVLNAADRVKSVGLVGLGIGTLAAYAREGQEFTFYEIDPGIVRVATDRRFFWYIADASERPGVTVHIKLGDGRLLLAAEEGALHDLIVLDAFSSDSIPAHLLTLEATQIYLSRLSERGIILFHTSNRHLNLADVLAANAKVLRLSAIRKNDIASAKQALEGKNNSEWVAVARRASDLDAVFMSGGWNRLIPENVDEREAWTDDFSNILGVLNTDW